MTLVGTDYRLTPISDHSPFFDVEVLAMVAPKGKEKREEWKNIGYGMTFEHALKAISFYKINKLHKDEDISIKTYINDFRRLSKSLEKAITE